MKKTSVLVVLLLLTILFLSAFKIEENTDKFDGTITVSIGNPAVAKITESKNLIKLEIAPVFVKNKDVSFYSIHVYYYGFDYMFIESGPSLKLLVGGEPKEFTSSEESNRVLSGYKGFYETIWYDVKPEDLLMISNSKKIEFRIVGSKTNIEGEFTKDMFKEFSEFCKYCNIK
jgi:hypothetical protein